MNICKVKSNKMERERERGKKPGGRDAELFSFPARFTVSFFGSARTQVKHSHHHITPCSCRLRQSLDFFCLLGRVKALPRSECGLAWLFLSNGALMSAMLMRNYQKLIKIKKGPKVKDLLITVPCKSPIIREREGEPNAAKTVKNALQGCTVSLPCRLA